MSISVSYFGNRKPAAGVKPIASRVLPDTTPRERLPFGGKNPLSIMDGKHLLKLRKEESPAAAEGSGLPDAAAKGDVAFWDGSKWVASAVGTPAAGDLLKWDGDAYVKVTPAQVTFLTAWRVDKTNHKFQVKTQVASVIAPAAASDWTDITDAEGGIMDPGATP